MRAAVYHGRGDIRIETVPVPAPSRGEILLRVSAVGVCGTDATEWRDGPRIYPIDAEHPITGHMGPLIPGHEFAGIVVATGPDVDSDLIGETVACGGVIVCGECRACQRGRAPCERYCCVGLHRDGALAEYVAVPLQSCTRTGAAGLSAAEAALCQPMAIALHACRRARVEAGDNAIVHGVGGVGAFLVYALTMLGARVTAVDPRADRRATASSLGAVHTIGPGDIELDGTALDLVFEVSGTPAGLAAGIRMLVPGSRLVLVGMQEHSFSIEFRSLTLNENEIIGANGLVPQLDLPNAVNAIAARRGRWTDIAPTVLRLDQVVSGALEPLANGSAGPIKWLVSPTSDQPEQ
jgi:(R,R)-butanediol dehydrogenase/meso-butanediol dehydrogenase/diacetyl reductase